MNLKQNAGSVIMVAVLLIILGTSLTLAAPVILSSLRAGSVIPGVEGLHMGIEGAEISSQFYRLGSTLPQGYGWVDASPSSTILSGGGGLLVSDGQVRIETGAPQSTQDPLTSPKEVDYWIQDGANWIHVKGAIVVYTASIGVSSRDMGAFSNSYIFHGERIWITLTDVTWNQAVQEQTATGKTIMGRAWEAPLEAVIVPPYIQSNLGDHYYLDPSEIGRTLTLYTTPKQSGTVSDLLRAPDLNGTLAGTLSPDSRLSQSVYFPITLTDYGSTQNWLSSMNPSTTITLKIYALRIGSFTYTNPDDTPWSHRPPELDVVGQVLASIGAWVSGLMANPLFWLGLVALTAAIVFVIFILYGGLALLPRRN